MYTGFDRQTATIESGGDSSGGNGNDSKDEITSNFTGPYHVTV